MPEHLMPIWDRRGAEINQLIHTAFVEVVSGAPDRSPAELQNDALSMLSQLAAMAGVQFILHLAEAKGVALPDAMDIGLGDIAGRVAHTFALLAAKRESEGATKQ